MTLLEILETLGDFLSIVFNDSKGFRLAKSPPKLQLPPAPGVPGVTAPLGDLGASLIPTTRPDPVRAQLETVLDKALSVTDRSVVIDFRCDPAEMVFPMVPAGASNDDIILGPEQAQPACDPAEAPIA